MSLKGVRSFSAIAAGVSFCLVLCLFGYGASAGVFRVKDVIDGDTVRLADGRMVRYIGVDTPEVRKRGDGNWVFAPEPFALEAKAYNASIVAGKSVDLIFDEQKEDKYGRSLAYVYCGGEMVNEEIIRNGYGIATIYPPNYKYAERMVAAQEDAKANKRGLWKDLKVVSSGEAGRYAGRVVTLRGRVAKAVPGKNAVYLHFEGVSRNDIAVEIWTANLVFFDNEGISLKNAYEGREIEVTGKIKDNRGLKLVVFHPSQIKVL